MLKSNMESQEHLLPFGIPPSRADIRVVLPLQSVENVRSKALKLGAENLGPVDWSKKRNLRVHNQGQCGNCWAMSSTATLNDRYLAIGQVNPDLDPIITTQCVPQTINAGCGGGQPAFAGQFFEKNGAIPPSSICPRWQSFYNTYSSNNQAPNLPTCAILETKCGFDTVSRFYAKSGSTTSTVASDANGNVDPAGTILNMKIALQKGPIVGAFLVPKDFMASSEYKFDLTNGVYINGAYNAVLDSTISARLKQALGNPTGAQWADPIVEGGGPAGHAIEIVGWGIQDVVTYGQTPYWIIKNSWGDTWMDNGYIKVAMNLPPHNHNNNLGLDIPVITLLISGKAMSLGGYFGGGTVFDPDFSPGRYNGPTPNFNGGDDDDSGTGSHKRKWLKPAIGIALFLLVAFLIYYYTGKSRS